MISSDGTWSISIIVRHAIMRLGSKFQRAIAYLNGSGAGVVVTPPSWRLRLTRWSVAFGITCCAYQLYALTVVPLIEPVVVHRREAGEPGELPGRETDPELVPLFPEDAWERNRPMILKTQWGKLLFQKYRTSEDGRLELVPCTIVVHAPAGADESAARRPIILQAPNKAVLNFSGPLNLLRAEFSKLQGAMLEGEVKIFSPESRPGANDALSLTTRNIQILPRQIWTPHDVYFQYGASHGSGRDLSISLGTSQEQEAARSRHSLVKNVELLELAHIDKLVINAPGKGLLGQRSSPLPAGTDAMASEGVASDEIEVTCQGPFQFDFYAGTASLKDHVDVVRAHPDGQGDQLNCSELTIYFAARGDKDVAAQTSADMPPAADSQSEQVMRPLRVRRMEAKGLPVTLRAPSVGVTARGQLLAYDFDTRQILLQDDQKALFVYQQHRTEAPRLQYQLDADPQRLGRLWATGPGVYEGQFGPAGEGSLRAAWSGVLELQPQEGIHVMSIVDGADITWQGTGRFSADELYVWLAEEVASPAAPAQPADIDIAPASGAGQQDVTAGLPEIASGAASGPPTAKKPDRPAVRPVKMLARGNVRADAPQFHGDTQRLEIWFDHPAREAAEPSDQPAPPAAAPGAAGAPPTGDKPADSAKRLELSGDQIRLRLLMVEPRPKVREATVMGSVRLAQTTTALSEQAASEPALMVTGDMLQLLTDHLERSAVDVSGAPARVHAQGMLLEGANLHVSQRENRMWADGPGRMRLPARTNRNAPGSLSSGTPVWIGWQEGMDFDGQLIRFLRRVEVRGIHTSSNGDRLHMLAIGDQLHVTLNRYVTMQRRGRTDDLDVIELRFLGDVYVENQTFNVDDVVTSRDRVKAREMILDRTTGKFVAAGPGWITSTRVDKGDIGRRIGSSPAGPASAVPAAPTGQWKASTSSKLIYLRVDFQNSIEGNVDRREAVFQHFVRTVYGPVESWDQVLNPDQPGGLGPQGIVMTCSRLLVAEEVQGQQRGVEMSALGKTVVEGNTFTAQAERLSYSQLKDQLVLEGDGRSLAELQHRGRVGERPTEFAAQKILYWVGTGQVEVFGGGRLDYTQVGSPSAPPARLR